MRGKKSGVKPEFAGAVVEMDWNISSINDDSREGPIESQAQSEKQLVQIKPIEARKKSSIKVNEDKPMLKENNKVSIGKPKRALVNILNNDNDELFSKDSEFLKLVFRTEKSYIDNYITLSNKLFLKLELNRKKQSFAYIFHLVLQMMYKDYENKFGEILYPSEAEEMFYKNNKTKGSQHIDHDEIVNRDSLTIKINKEDYKLLFGLMNTRFSSFDNKPTRYSINFFFFEIVRYMEGSF